MARGRSGKAKVRFDDSLTTVLSSDTDTGVGASATWRQLLDLMGRGRIPADEDILARLRVLRPAVPTDVRAASARALAFAAPDAALVAFVAEDGLAIAAPVLRTAVLAGGAWATLVPRIGPAGRSVLRGRRDLPVEAIRALESFGPTDFALSYEGQADAPPPSSSPLPVREQTAPRRPDAPLMPSAFTSLGEVARGLPVVAEALRRAEHDEQVAPPPSPFQIADLVARIDAFRRDHAADAVETPSVEADRFRFSADADGTIREVDGDARPALIGASIGREGRQGQVTFSGSAAAVTRRARILDGRLTIEGGGATAGMWRIVASPVFGQIDGRFAGYRGTASRVAVPASRGPAAIDSLRQLVHELRTPANAILGFAELIDMQLLGAVPDHYRERAGTIRAEAGDFLGAIDDLDTMARLESAALDVRTGVVAVLPLVRRLVNDLQPLARARGVALRLASDSGYREAAADDRLAERVLHRLFHLLVAEAQRGEELTVAIKQGSRAVKIVADTPLGFSLDMPADPADDASPPGGYMLLGTRFTVSLLQRLVAELGGSLSLKSGRLTLRLPAASGPPVHGAPDPLT